MYFADAIGVLGCRENRHRVVSDGPDPTPKESRVLFAVVRAEVGQAAIQTPIRFETPCAFYEAVIKMPSVRNVMLITSYDETTSLQELASRTDASSSVNFVGSLLASF